MKISRLLAGTALALSMAGAAHAAPADGSLAVGLLGVASSTATIGTGTTFTFALSAVSSGTGDFAGIMPGTMFTTAPITATIGSPITFTSGFGDFSGTVSLAAGVGPVNSRTVTVFTVGTFTGAGALAGFDAGPASITFSATQTGGPGSAVSASFSLSSPPSPPPVTDVPEPMSLALFGLGLAGLGVSLRRKA